MATLLLLCAGALVTGTGSGLAVPDWPLSYGQFFPPMVGGVLYEHGHRLIAGFVALLTVFQAVVLQKLEARRWVKVLGWVAVAIVLFQASLGGMTVLFLLPKAISIFHACLAQLFFCTTVVLAMVTTGSWRQLPAAVPNSKTGALPWLGLVASLGLFVQLFLGATMRHFGAGAAIPDFPKSFGQWVPALDSFPVLIHFAHRAGAVLALTLVVATVIGVYRKYWNQFYLILYAGTLMGAIWTQVMLGAMVIWLRRPVALTTLHLALGAVCLATSVALTVLLFRQAATRPSKESFSPFLRPGLAAGV